VTRLMILYWIFFMASPYRILRFCLYIFKYMQELCGLHKKPVEN